MDTNKCKPILNEQLKAKPNNKGICISQIFDIFLCGLGNFKPKVDLWAISWMCFSNCAVTYFPSKATESRQSNKPVTELISKSSTSFLADDGRFLKR